MISATLTCPHFGVCGGCSLAKNGASPPYEEQLASKEQLVRGLLKDFDVAEWRPILPSPDQWHYRNKMEYAFGAQPDVLGLRQAGRFDRIVDLQDCLFMSPDSFELLKRVRAWAWGHGLHGYHRNRHEGDLRYLVIRETKNTRQRMAILLGTSTPVLSDESALAELEAQIRPLLTTFWIGTTDSKSDQARTPDMRLRWGPGTLQEKLNGRLFRISPYSFFQTNSRGTERLYGLLRDWSEPLGGALLDMYCGSGGIGLSIADCFDRLIGVDSNVEAIEDARFNAALNHLSNTEFVAEDAVDFFKKLPASKLSVQLSAVVVDPPRPGLHPKALASLVELNPLHIAYVSCNPESLARDLQTLNPFYRMKTAQSVDLFPHTPHVETLVTLEHR